LPARCSAGDRVFGKEPVDFEPTREQKEFGDRARRFAHEVVRPLTARVGGAAMFPPEIVGQLGALQLMSAALPAPDGGGGKGHVGYVLALTEISKACASLGAAVFVNNSLYCTTLLEFEKRDQRAKYLLPCASGEGIGSVPLNHPHSDPANVGVRASRSGSGWILNGQQPLFCNGLVPSHCVVPAETAERGGATQISLFVLDLRDRAGIRWAPGEGPYHSETINLHLENCELEGDALLGEAGKGTATLMKAAPKSWIGLAAHSIGVGRALLGGALDFVFKTGPAGRVPFSSQAVQWALTDAALLLDAAELLTLKAAWLADRSKPFEKEAAMAKIYGADGAMKAALESVQVMGGEGLSRIEPLWELMRHAKKCQVALENNLGMKGLVAGHLVRELKGSI